MHPPFSRLRVNGARRPRGVDSPTVRLSWVADAPLKHTDELVIELTNTPDRVVPHDTRAVVVPAPTVRWAGWRVGLRRDGTVTWSERHTFTTAPDISASGASWITHPDVATTRKPGDDRSVWFAFTLDSHKTDIANLLHLAAPGVVDVRIDGRSAGDGVLGPGYSDLTEETSAATYDLGTLSPGRHTVTIELASGPYWISETPDRYTKFVAHHRGPQVIAMIEQFGDTTRTTVTRPGETRTGRGATTAAHWYGGEDFDAGLAEPWHATDAVESVAPDSSPTDIWWPEHPPLKVVETLSGRRPAQDVIDFGINIAGVPRVRWSAAPEERHIELHPAELLGPDGIDQDSTGSPIVDRLHIPAGSAGEWAPRFGYHGFRYVGLKGQPVDIDVDALVIRAANDRAGSFTSGDPFVQRLHDVIDRAVQGNMHSVFTDCPHREKLGWLEQLHFCFGAIVRGFDVEAHLRDMLHHARRAQLPSGAIPNTVPEFVDFSGHAYLGDDDAFRFDVNWGGVIVHLSLAHYREYGDRRVLEDNLAAMKAYIGYLDTRQNDGLIDFGLGDWIALDTSAPRALVASHGYLRVLEAAQHVAHIVEDDNWSASLQQRSDGISRALRQYEQIGWEASQSALVILTDLAERRGDSASADRAFALLIERIETDGGAFTVGEVTFALMVEMLHRRGYGELVLRTISRTDVPGYGMQIARGVTSLAETWSGERLAVGEGSNNHFMLGMIEDWLHHHVAGLRQEQHSIGWQVAVVAPTFLADVPSAASVYHSVRGTYGVDWRRTEDRILVTITVPSDGSAEVVIPGIQQHIVTAGVHRYSVHGVDSTTVEELVIAHD